LANLKGADLRRANLAMANLTRADFYWANLTGADLTGADLYGTALTKANLEGANLRGANLDYSSLPLWCGGLKMKIDEKLAIQFLYHALKQECDSIDYQKIKNNPDVIRFLERFHRIKEVKGEIKNEK
jgi:hypothetical protein